MKVTISGGIFGGVASRVVFLDLQFHLVPDPLHPFVVDLEPSTPQEICNTAVARNDHRP